MSDTTRRDFVAGAATAGAAFAPSQAMAQGSTMNHGVTQNMTYEDVKKLLNLEPNATCGYVRLTFVSEKRIAPGGLPAPFADGRPLGSALYFMLTPDEPVKLHRIRNDQFYHYYLGDPIEVLMMLTDGSTQQHIVGPDLRAGHKVQLFIPGNTFHTARVIGTRQWFLGGSTEWPGVEPADVELGKAEELAAKYPSVADKIRTWPLPVKK
jgi:predicted cupin superfamily sugar epimerase